MELSCPAGGLIIKDDSVLLVKITYGANKDYWMLPGGLVKKGETFEEAAIREIKEETGLATKSKRLIGVRTGVKFRNNEIEHGIYFVFEMKVISGTIRCDGSEVSDVKFRPIDEALLDPMVIGLSQEIILPFKLHSTQAGLYKAENAIRTNNHWASYEVFTVA
ncbi:NUDIX domain-containing protein [Paenibacillus tarimensis]